MSDDEKPFRPNLLDGAELDSLKATVGRLASLEPFEGARALRESADRWVRATAGGEAARYYRAAVAASVLADLAEQGWSLRTSAGDIVIKAPSAEPIGGETFDQAKGRHRHSLLKSSDRQLASPAVQDFLRQMERPSVFEGRVVSIANLIDDGKELASQIAADESEADDGRAERLKRFIRPVVQSCDPDARCQHTGFRLLDIWRYFRHTWSLEYNPLPGRTLRFLVRNAARPNAPIMGIAMLASPAANLIVRDRWIGWRLEELTTGLIEGKWRAGHVGRALTRVVDEAISDVRWDDLLTAEEMERGDASTIFKLNTLAATAGSSRLADLQSQTRGETATNLVDIRSLGKDILTEQNWRDLSETSLFKRKRAEQLVPLLRARSYFLRNNFTRDPAIALLRALASREGRDAVQVALNENKKRRLATEIADLSVCGAISPYNHILGGKLVALLMTSKEVRECYARRYGTQISEIASQLAGRPVVRPAELRVLTTTSLYGIGSSQYNRLKLRARQNKMLKYDIEWVELDQTEGFTITHLSSLTVDYMRRLGIIVYETRRINSVFGEGSSPKTRQIREGLNLIGINNEHVLKHAMRRRVYTCELFPGARDALTGFAKAKVSPAPTVASITSAWLARWVESRVRQEAILDKMREATSEEVMSNLRTRSHRGAFDTLKSGNVT